jgi:hypothetical protein
VRRGLEELRAPRPAPLLDAGDGDLQRRLRLDEHRDVEDAVLLRAHEFLAVVQQDAFGEWVLDHELRDASRLVDLANVQAAGERLVERDLVVVGIVSGKERCHDDSAVLHVFPELEEVLDHLRLLSGSRRSPAPGVVPYVVLALHTRER